MYTFMATCKANDVNPNTWLEDTLKKLMIQVSKILIRYSLDIHARSCSDGYSTPNKKTRPASEIEV
jgi:hypothetical protein